jgi:hypothetical protein
MYKLLIFPVILAFMFVMYAYQIDQELAMRTLFQSKHGINRAVHAAAQQMNEELLANGTYAIEPNLAKETALEYLRHNLYLDDHNRPLPESFLKAEVEILVLEIINNDRDFPFDYTHEAYDYSVTLERPGVIMIAAVEYPRMFKMIQPIHWKIKGASELVY